MFQVDREYLSSLDFTIASLANVAKVAYVRTWRACNGGAALDAAERARITAALRDREAARAEKVVA